MGHFIKKKILLNIVVALFFLGAIVSCERDLFDSHKYGNFTFSTDTVMFDTVFTSIGTATYKLVVKNPNDFNLFLDSVYLAGKSANGYVINIDGESSLSAKNLVIDAGDSLYIFIQSFVPANDDNNPFLKEDSIIFVSGDQISNVKLIAVAQNVISFRNTSIQSQEWSNQKPYLVFGTLTLDASHILTIREGARVYFHKNAKMVINGTLNILGTHDHPVLFKSDRLEKDYDSIPGQWGGIELYGKEQRHLIDNAIIRNATTGLKIGNYKNSDIVKADITNAIISNMGYSALLSYQAELSLKNCIIANSANILCGIYGGNYEFLHCTLANYGAKYVARSVSSKSLLVQNYIQVVTNDGNIEVIDKSLDKAYFANSIVYGNSSNEIILSGRNGESVNYTFENCLLNISNVYLGSGIINSITNETPKFKNPLKEDFSLDTLSPAKDKGKAEIGILVPFDLNNNSRNVTIPDLGAIERIEE